MPGRRDVALRETFDLTQALSPFPHPDRFVELQIQLTDAFEREADLLASLPAPAGIGRRRSPPSTAPTNTGEDPP